MLPFYEQEKHLWNAYHLIIFIAMGAVGGLLGALFNDLNINLTTYRMKYLYKRSQSKIWRYSLTTHRFLRLLANYNMKLARFKLGYFAHCVYKLLYVFVFFRIVEVLLIALVTTAGVFTCSMLFGTCLHESERSVIMNNGIADVRVIL